MRLRTRSFLVVVLAAGLTRIAQARPEATQVTLDWTQDVLKSRSTPTLQVVVNPPLRRGTPIHDQAFAALQHLAADNVRYVPWLPYPKLAVAELEPPTSTGTSWDFSLIDPMTLDFLQATQGHPTILNFSTAPAWMFVTAKPVNYPADPNQVFWDYTQGTELKDPTGKQLGDYYARLVSWYTQGEFTDEHGDRHVSGHHFRLPWWEVLNEPDSEHHTTPQNYTRRYDAIVNAIHTVSPATRFMGLALADAKALAYYEYFLNPANHRPGTPLDAISFHFYAQPGNGPLGGNPDAWHFCEQADGFLQTVRTIDAIRRRLSPSTQIDVDELGVIAPDDSWQNQPIYWNAAGAMYAYLYVELSKLRIETIGESQLVGYPSQFPSVSMVNWTTGKPNARFRVLELLKNHFGPGDLLVPTVVSDASIAAQAYRTASGRKLLLINKENAPVDLVLPPDTVGTPIDTIDLQSGEEPARRSTLSTARMVLPAFAVAVVTFTRSE